jgi:hypothetical protein
VHDELGADIAAGAGFYVNDKRLAEMILQPLPDQAGMDVGRACSGLRHD